MITVPDYKMPQRYPILDIWCDAVSMPEALSKVVSFIEQGDRLHTIFAANPEKNYSVPRDPMLYDMFRRGDLLLPDGIGMVLALRLLHGVKLVRLPGCELMQSICGLSAENGYAIFIYGAREEVNKLAVERLRHDYPRLRIVGRAHGYLPAGATPALVKQINDSEAQILFLALGSPQQEQWISRYENQLKRVRVCQGIGGTLDVLAGRVTRAPEAYCKLGLEWLYRLISEPNRLARQMILPKFVLQIVQEKFSHLRKACLS
jgi:N-acetylglucosaminyldiphosphoundecaprenol N-acetyl-beta-D-mannosaminyltransferase